MKKTIQRICDIKTVLGMQGVASLIVLFFVIKLNALPILYLVGAIAVLLILLGISFLLIKTKKEKSVRSIIGKIISVVISALLLIASIRIYQGDSLIGKITGGDSEMHVLSVIVMKENEASKIEDLKNAKFGSNQSIDTEYLEEVTSKIEEKIGLVAQLDYSSFPTLATALYSGEVDAIIMNEAYRTICEEKYPNFSTETKVIYTIEFKEKLNDITKSVGVTKNPFTVYISGIDSYGPVNTVSRTDVNIIMTVNPKTKQVLLTSIPRDTYVTFASSWAKDKITHSGIYGINETLKTVENWLEIDINYYVRVNFTSLTKIIDALGGITVNSPNAFKTDRYSFIQGNNELDGDKALAFVRERNAFSSGDKERGQNQMRVITAMINKMLSPAIIKNYTGVLKAVEGSFQTNMASSDITDLVKMQLGDMASWTIKTQQINGYGSMDLPSYALGLNSGVYVMVPYEESVNKAIDNINRVLNGGEAIID